MGISLPEEVSFHHDGVVATPTGPRSRRWVSEVADAPGRGADIFPWLRRGIGADYYLGRALARMWTDVRWRPPGADAYLLPILRETLPCRERARAADPSLDYPGASGRSCTSWRATRCPPTSLVTPSTRRWRSARSSATAA